jgi:hypothetical protein
LLFLLAGYFGFSLLFTGAVGVLAGALFTIITFPLSFYWHLLVSLDPSDRKSLWRIIKFLVTHEDIFVRSFVIRQLEQAIVSTTDVHYRTGLGHSSQQLLNAGLARAELTASQFATIGAVLAELGPDQEIVGLWNTTKEWYPLDKVYEMKEDHKFHVAREWAPYFTQMNHAFNNMPREGKKTRIVVVDDDLDLSVQSLSQDSYWKHFFSEQRRVGLKVIRALKESEFRNWIADELPDDALGDMAVFINSGKGKLTRIVATYYNSESKKNGTLLLTHKNHAQAEKVDKVLKLLDMLDDNNIGTIIECSHVT